MTSYGILWQCPRCDITFWTTKKAQCWCRCRGRTAMMPMFLERRVVCGGYTLRIVVREMGLR